MNYNFINQLLDNGFSEEELLASLSKSIPHLGKKARNMLLGGWSFKDILNMFSQDKNAQKIARKGLKPVTPSEIASIHLQNSYNNIPKSADQQTKEELTSFTKKAAPFALGAISSPVASSVLGEALERALPKQSPLAEQSSQMINNQQQMQDSQISLAPEINDVSLNSTQKTPSGLGNANIITKGENIEQPKGIINSKEYLEKKGVLNEVISSLKKGNNPEQVAAQIGIKKSGHAKIDPELLRNIEDFSSSYEETSQNLLKSTELVDKANISSKADNAPLKEEDLSIVASPQGFGEVKVSRNGKSIIDVDGKKHQVEDSKILKPPKEAAIEALELIKSFTPEQQRSTHHMLNAYDPDSKQGFFVFHNGSAYVVDDVSEEEYKELSEEIEQAKTTGESIIGKYAAGEGSRGAAYNKIVKGVRDRKVVPEKKKKFKKLQVGYNLLAEWQRLLNEK